MLRSRRPFPIPLRTAVCETPSRRASPRIVTRIAAPPLLLTTDGNPNFAPLPGRISRPDSPVFGGRGGETVASPTVRASPSADARTGPGPTSAYPWVRSGAAPGTALPHHRITPYRGPVVDV